MLWTRRQLLAATLAGAIPQRWRQTVRKLEMIEAPNNLGLRPPRPDVEPGTWRGPQALEAAGLSKRLRPEGRELLSRPRYAFEGQEGTRIRNGVTLRSFNLELAAAVTRSLRRGAFPVVIGGDCSNVLGCLLGLRQGGGRGLVHVDGHSDFFHPGNYEPSSRLGSAAGMDLALATGRGEALLTRWPGFDGALVADEDAVQIGEREADDPAYAYRDIQATQIDRTTVQGLHVVGVSAVAAKTVRRLEERRIERAWLHVDLDVLDQGVMPAVDSPGSPGLTYAELASLVSSLLGSGRIAGMDFAIYDPDLDQDGRYARELVSCIGEALG